MLASRHASKPNSSTSAEPNQPDLLSLLLSLHPHPLPLPLEATDNAGNTPLHHASAWGNLKAIRTLLEVGADPGARNEWSWTPVAYSASVQAEVYFRGLVNNQTGGTVGRNGEVVGRERGGSGGRSARSGSGGDVGSAGSGGSPSNRARGGSGGKMGVRMVRADSLGEQAVANIEGLPRPDGRLRQAMLEVEKGKEREKER